MPEASSPELTSWAARWATEHSTEQAVEEFVGLVDGAIIKEIPEIASDPMLIEDLHRSTHYHWLAFLAALSQPEHLLTLPTQAADLARSIARRGHDIGVLLKVYRAAHEGIFASFTQSLDRLKDGDPPREEVLKFLWRRADQWIDESIERLIEVFYAERQIIHDGALVRRAAVMEALLDGSPMEVAEASKALAHPLLRWQSAFVLWTNGHHPDAAQHLQEVADDLAAGLGGSPPLVRAAGSRELWCWVATPGRPEPNALSGLDAVVAAHHVHVAAGLPGRGVDGFRSSHAEARATQKLCLTARHPHPLVSYRDVELLCLTSDNEDLLRRMVVREVGPLCAADKNLALIRETVLTYLTTRLNVDATAEKLFVHKNTVRYRLTRAEELLGHPLSERVAEVELGLRYVALLGPPSAAT